MKRETEKGETLKMKNRENTPFLGETLFLLVLKTERQTKTTKQLKY